MTLDAARYPLVRAETLEAIRQPDAPLLDPETAARIERENTTVGQYERLAGIGQSLEERLAF